jgi:hypothetical protein
VTRSRDIAAFLGKTEANNTQNLVLLNTSSEVGFDSAEVTSIAAPYGTQVFDSAQQLPLVGLIAGQRAFTTNTNRFYISNGSGWYSVATINATPTFSLSPDASYILASDGVTATTITILATDPEGFAITYSAIADSDFNGLATVSQDSSVFTITPKSEANATTTTGTLTFKATDGVNIASEISTFTLTFGPDYTSATKTTIFPDEAATIGQSDFGFACSISGDGNYAVVGATFDRGTYNGTAYFFSKSGSTWSQMVRTWPGNDAGYGNATAMNSDGTYAVVSAWYDDANGTNSGAVFVYNRSGSTWSQQQKVISPDTDNLPDNFGFDVDINPSATYMIVGSPGDDTGGTDRGAAMIYTRSGSTWTLQQKIQSSDAQNSDLFGKSVSINSDGSYAIIGAPSEDGASTDVGAAYIFTRSGSTWTQQAKLTASDAQTSDYFSYGNDGGGVSINDDGTYVVIGATNEDGGAGDPLSNAGAAYVFTRSGSTWTEQAKITASDAAANDWLGYRVIMNSDATLMAIMARSAAHPTYGTNAGAIYVYTRSGSTWTEQEILRPRGPGTSGRARGLGMTSDGSSILVGSIYDQVSGYSNVGAAYIFEAG